jgi:hypothetical protein
MHVAGIRLASCACMDARRRVAIGAAIVLVGTLVSAPLGFWVTAVSRGGRTS